MSRSSRSQRPSRPIPVERPSGKTLRHHWWHDATYGTYYAVATDDAGRITSAWMQIGAHEWVPLDRFAPLRRALARGEMHVNDAPDGYTDELGPSLGRTQ